VDWNFERMAAADAVPGLQGITGISNNVILMARTMISPQLAALFVGSLALANILPRTSGTGRWRVNA
jgi:hypothetical protein